MPKEWTMAYDEDIGPTLKRRSFLGFTALVSAGLGAIGGRRAEAHNLLPGQFGSPAYEKAAGVEIGYRAVFQSPHVEATFKLGDNLEHLLLAQAKNWLNGFQFSYKTRPEDLHVISATYASANLLTYNDSMWQKYRFGEKYGVIDPKTNAPAIRNPFWPSRFPKGSTDPDHPESIYQDSGMEALQKRGVLFLT
jgi:hypothetical protein